MMHNVNTCLSFILICVAFPAICAGSGKSCGSERPVEGGSAVNRELLMNILTNRVICSRGLSNGKGWLRRGREESGASEQDVLAGLSAVIRNMITSPDNTLAAAKCVTGIKVYSEVAHGKDLLFLRDVSIGGTNECSRTAASCFIHAAERQEGVAFARQMFSSKDVDPKMRARIWSALNYVAIDDRRPDTLKLMQELAEERRREPKDAENAETLSLAIRKGNQVFAERIERSERATRMRKKLMGN